jgi:hypothetical protein
MLHAVCDTWALSAAWPLNCLLDRLIIDALCQIFLSRGTTSFFLSSFLSYSGLFLPPHCRCTGLLLHLITLTDTHTVGRTILDEGSARRRDLHLTTHNTHKRQTTMSRAGFEPSIPAIERPQSHALHRMATGIGLISFYDIKFAKREGMCCTFLIFPVDGSGCLSTVCSVFVTFLIIP